jgi:hypothetical protein
MRNRRRIEVLDGIGQQRDIVERGRRRGLVQRRRQSRPDAADSSIAGALSAIIAMRLRRIRASACSSSSRAVGIRVILARQSLCVRNS